MRAENERPHLPMPDRPDTAQPGAPCATVKLGDELVALGLIWGLMFFAFSVGVLAGSFLTLQALHVTPCEPSAPSRTAP